MPAKAGIHALPAESQTSKALLFLKKKEAKKLLLLRALAWHAPKPAGPKVFCFPGRGAFFSKKKRFPCLP